MDIEPWKRWELLKLKVMWLWPQEPRGKIKKFLKLGDRYQAAGKRELAGYSYRLAKGLAKETGTVHLLKKIRQRVM